MLHYMINKVERKLKHVYIINTKPLTTTETTT